MNYGNIKYNDIANGIGIRTSLFVSGCTHHCPGCFNQIAWDFNYGQEFKTQTELDIITSLQYPWIKGLSILGGEPFEPQNLPMLVGLVDHVRQTTICDIWCYSGYTFEQMMEMADYRDDIMPFLENIDVLVDGRFEEAKKNLNLRFRGSENQRIIDVQKTLNNNNKIILLDI